MGQRSWRDLLCPKCHQLKTTCTCRSEPPTPSKSTVVRVGRETKGRRGKGVTIVSDVPLDGDGLTELAANLKQRRGTGGNGQGWTDRDSGRPSGSARSIT